MSDPLPGEETPLTTQPTTVRTADDRKLTYTATPDEYGRVVYQVAGVGAFTLQVDPRSRAGEDGAGWRVNVTYGRVEGPQRYLRSRELPDRPVVCRVELEGGAVFSVDTMRADVGRSSRWLACYRSGGGTAPDGTRNRTADIVHTLVNDWVARDDWEELRSYQDWHLAPGRRADYARAIDTLNGKVAKLLQELAVNHRGYTTQAAILGETTPRPARFPDPVRREGQAILALRTKLQALQKEKRCLPGGDVVTIAEAWFAGMDLDLTDY